QRGLRHPLGVVFSIEPEALDAAVPNLVLLPLCEGAIANGVSARPGGGRIEIRARLVDASLHVAVRETPADSAATPALETFDDSFVRKTRLRLRAPYPRSPGTPPPAPAA